MTSDIYFTATSWFPGKCPRKTPFKAQCGGGQIMPNNTTGPPKVFHLPASLHWPLCNDVHKTYGLLIGLNFWCALAFWFDQPKAELLLRSLLSAFCRAIAKKSPFTIGLYLFSYSRSKWLDLVLATERIIEALIPVHQKSQIIREQHWMINLFWVVWV